MSLHKVRQEAVDWAKTALAATFGSRVYDRFFPVLDLENASAMGNQFPALVVSLPSQDFDLHLDGVTGIQILRVDFEVVGLVRPSRLYSPSEAVRAAEVTNLRATDDAAAALVSALVSLGTSAPINNWQGAGFRLASVALESTSEQDDPADAPDARYISTTVTAVFTTQT